MWWETNRKGNFRVVRLTRCFAFKSPHIFDYRGLCGEWRHFGNPNLKPSIVWLWRTWLKLFRENRLVNENEFQRFEEWTREGSQKVNGLGLCPILFHLPWGLLNVMPRAFPVPEDRINMEHDFLSNGAVSFEEMNAACILIGRNADTGKQDTYGFVDGELVIVDYGWPPARP